MGHVTFFKSDMQTRLDDRANRDLQFLKTWAALCAAVDRRDHYRCRACGVRVVRTMTVVENRLERHHVKPISLGGLDKTSNVATLCLRCHEDRHVRYALHITGNADKTLTMRRGGQKWLSPNPSAV